MASHTREQRTKSDPDRLESRTTMGNGNDQLNVPRSPRAKETRERNVRLPEYEPNVVVPRVVLPAPDESLKGIQPNRNPLYRRTDITRIRIRETTGCG